MRRLQFGLLSIGLPLFVVCLALSGCKKVDEPENSHFWADLQGSSKAATAVAKTPISMGKGVIQGKVVWKGAKPDLPKLDKDMLATLGSKDPKVCLSPECSKDEKDQQIYRIGTNDTVGHVVVWLTPTDKNSYFAFTDDDLKALNLKPVKEFDQPHCAFIPHVDWAFTHYLAPDLKNPRKMNPSGQVVKVRNNATISHNTKWADTGKIRLGNVLLPPGGEPITLPLVPETRPLRIECSIHAWMDAFVWDFDHPYADVSKCDGLEANADKYGTFEIKNVPTGVKLKITAWHEEGQVAGGGEIEVTEGEPLIHNFEISKK